MRRKEFIYNVAVHGRAYTTINGIYIFYQLDFTMQRIV